MNYVRQCFEKERKTMYEDIINPLKQHHINELLLYLDIASCLSICPVNMISEFYEDITMLYEEAFGKWKNGEYEFKKEI